jgi:hypothetical protein
VCPGLSLLVQTVCRQEEAWPGLFKAPCYQLFAAGASQLGSSLSQLKEEEGEEEGENDNWLPPIYRCFLSNCFHLFHFLSEKMESCPGYSLLMALVICHL